MKRSDVLLSDLRMAGLDGYGLIAEIKERAVAAGFDRHVSKPIDPDDLLSALA